jgi:soluble lytic murein transglycosylase-like protein
MQLPSQTRVAFVLSALVILLCLPSRAAERVTVRGGAQFDCVRRETDGDHVRLYLLPTVRANTPAESSNYIQIPADSVLSVEEIPDPPPPPPATPARSPATALTPAEMAEMLSRAGSQHNIDADLLASVVKAESNGNERAVSRAGAQGLMQLMPGTASSLGIHDSFVPEQNIGGGTAYLDQLLKRYKDNIALALAAYNAGPLAVDRYHGIPPYRETRAYVGRVIREFNRRKLVASASPAIAPGAH